MAGAPFAASAEVLVPEQFTSYEFPSDWGLSFNYEQDAAKVRNHMVTATGLGKGAERMEDYGKNMKKEMVDFVSYYRRFPNVAGKPSFSTLYTSINVLAGHYTSYGYKYPLPEKRVSLVEWLNLVQIHVIRLSRSSSSPFIQMISTDCLFFPPFTSHRESVYIR